MTARPTTPIVAGAGGTTGGDGATFLNDLNAWAAQLPGADAVATVAIASGIATPSAVRSSIRVDTEGAAATDTLDRIAVANYPDGSLILLSIVDASRKVTVSHLAGSSGQISLAGAAAFQVKDPTTFLLLRLEGSTWVEAGLMFGNQAADGRTRLGLGNAATLNLASQAQAEAATSATVLMTPQRSGQAIAVARAADFDSGELTFILGAAKTFVVGDETDPDPLINIGPTTRVVVTMHCAAGDAGYSAGDIVPFEMLTNVSMVIADATDSDVVRLVFKSSPAAQIPHSSSAVFTDINAASWRVRIRAWK